MSILSTVASSLRGMTSEHVASYKDFYVGLVSLCVVILVYFLIHFFLFADSVLSKSILGGLFILVAGGMTYWFLHIGDAEDEALAYMKEVDESISSEIMSSYNVESATLQFDPNSSSSYNAFIYQLNTRDTDEKALISIELNNGDVYDYKVLLTSNDESVLREPHEDGETPLPV